MIVFVDPPSPPGFIAFRHSHGGYGECCKTSRLKFPTLDLFHSASLLLDRGYAASVVDSVLLDHGIDQCVDAVLSKRPEAVVLRTASGSCPHDLETARALRRRFDGPIVFYGPHAEVEADAILKSGPVDAVLYGEAPFPFLDLAERRRVERLASFRSRRMTRAPAKASMPDVDALPIPRWDLVDYRKYSYVTAQTSWGCPFRCGYCPYPVTQGEAWRARSVASVVEEFEALRDRYGLRFVLLRDPEFTLDRERTQALCRALIRAGVPITWGCETRLDTLDDALAALMAEAGCMRVAFGVETIHEPALRAMGRKSPRPAEIRAKVEGLKRLGMLTYAMYIVGLPGETAESARRTAEFALELDTNAASFSMATPFPGTRLEALGRERGATQAEDPLHLTGCVPSMRTETLSMNEVERLYLSAKGSWNGRKRDARSSAPSSRL
ncbi:MAG: radical SAM protein [Elusimicrobia bacterium]|nr:radical SAM protein [Elusimicrobiota bacterium]